MENHRQQWPVGQGGFHTAELREGERLRLRYVYDCGAMEKYKTAREACIEKYLDTVNGGKLDILFLSHVHADHVNGVEQLLDTESGIRVETIMLPLVSTEDRLLAFARAAAEDPASVDNEFYQSLIVDPFVALSRFGPDRIIFIREGGEGGAPGGSDRPIDPLDGPPLDEGESKTKRDRPRWTFVGSGQIEKSGDATGHGGGSGGPERMVVAHSIGFEIAAAKEDKNWLLAPYVDPTVKAKREDFLNRLVAEIKPAMTRLELDIWLKDSTNVRTLIVEKRADLVAAYTEVARDLNITSMCLYSGLERHSVPPIRGEVIVRFGTWSAVLPQEPNVGWIGTGDAALKQEGRRNAFGSHYGAHLQSLMTLTMPHHGSDHNFHPDLLDMAPAKFFVANADSYGKWKHPGSKVIQSVASQGKFLSVVTSGEASMVYEWARIP